ncbi:MAG: hypothetical protein ACYTGB_06370 [Planctomycetota bacterium]
MNGESTEKKSSRRSAAAAIVTGVIIALIVAGLAALLLGGASEAQREAAEREEEVRRRGVEAALALAEKGKEIVAEFQKRDLTKSWQVKEIEWTDFDPEGKLGALQALVLCGDTLVASSDPTGAPLGVTGVIELSGSPNVDMLRGTIITRTAGGNRMVACLQFKAVFSVPGSPTPCSVRIIVPLEE